MLQILSGTALYISIPLFLYLGMNITNHIIMNLDRIPGSSFERFLLFADGVGLPANYPCMQHKYALIKSL